MEEYNAKKEAGTLTIEDMDNSRFLMPYEEAKKKWDANDWEYSTTYTDKNGIHYVVLDDGTVLHSGDYNPVSNGIWNGDNDADYEYSLYNNVNGWTKEDLQEISDLFN